MSSRSRQELIRFLREGDDRFDGQPPIVISHDHEHLTRHYLTRLKGQDNALWQVPAGYKP